MGKRIIVQRRGKGSVFESPGHKHRGNVEYPKVRSLTEALVTSILHDPGRTAPVVELKLPDGETVLGLAAEGTHIGQKIALLGEELLPGNVMPLAKIPEGTPVHNLELRPGDGGKMVRAAGTTASIVGRQSGRMVVRLPSGQFKEFDLNCRATIGVVAGGGRGEKPFAKAGKKYHSVKSRAKQFPIVRGVAKNPVDHPHGGGNAHRKEGKPTTVSRNAPPGRKVGHIAARRTGIRS